VCVPTHKFAFLFSLLWPGGDAEAREIKIILPLFREIIFYLIRSNLRFFSES
jgi:hypothetical protein